MAGEWDLAGVAQSWKQRHSINCRAGAPRRRLGHRLTGVGVDVSRRFLQSYRLVPVPRSGRKFPERGTPPRSAFRISKCHDSLQSKSGRTDAISVSVELQQMSCKPQLILCRQQVKTRWRPVYALETGGSPSPDGQDFEDNGFLGRTRLGRLVQAAARELLRKLNSARTNSPTKIFLVLLGFYTANALATILGQTGDWDVLVAGIVVAAIEGIGMLMYKKPFARPPGRFQSLISMINYWKAGVCLGLFVDAFKLGS